MTKDELEPASMTASGRELNDLAALALTSIKHFKQAIVNNQIGSPVDPDDAEDVKRKKPKAEKEGNLVIQPARGLLVASKAGPNDLSISKGEYTAGKGWVHKTEGNLDSAYKGKISEFFFGPKDNETKEDTTEKGMGDLGGIMGMPGLNDKDPDARAVIQTMNEVMEQLQQTIKVLEQQNMTQRVPQEVAHTPMDMREGNNRKQPNMPDNRE